MLLLVLLWVGPVLGGESKSFSIWGAPEQGKVWGVVPWHYVDGAGTWCISQLLGGAGISLDQRDIWCRSEFSVNLG